MKYVGDDCLVSINPEKHEIVMPPELNALKPSFSKLLAIWVFWESAVVASAFRVST